jgi:hypothetical protein
MPPTTKSCKSGWFEYRESSASSDYLWQPEMLPEPSTGAYQLGDFGCDTWCIGRGCLVPGGSRPVSEGSRIRYLEILAGYRTPIQTGI